MASPAAIKLAGAVRAAARAQAEETPGCCRATITRWEGEEDFACDVHGSDLELDEEDITLGQSVRSLALGGGLDVDDVLILVEVGEGDYVAVDAEADGGPAAGADVGDVKWTARIAAPVGWIACDGTVITVASGFTALRAALIADGSPYGASGSDPRVPDLRGRVPVGAGTGAGLTARTAGQAFGAETHQLTVAQMPTHTHRAGQGVGALTAGGSGFNQRFAGVDTGYNEDTGGSESHPNVQPSLCLLAIIKT